MPRDMTGTGRYPPVPRYQPIAFYSAVRQGDPELLHKIMDTDSYFITQDNGAGAPVHFAVTYRQLDMLHHLLNNGAEVNQRDGKGFTPLHRAAYLAHLDGYREIYEYLLSRGADPSIRTEDFDPYLNPGCKLPVDLAAEDEAVRSALRALEAKYEHVPKAAEPHPCIGCWWSLYDYGLDVVKTWSKDHKHAFPEDLKREREREQQRRQRQERQQKRQDFLKALAEGGPEAARLVVKPAPQALLAASQGSAPAAPEESPIAFLFPGQGSQAVGMLKETKDLPAVRAMLDKAKEVLGFDLLDVCLNGPKERLDDTTCSQPALFVAGLAAVEKMKAGDPSVVARCSASAGLSLGEYSALVFSGALSFEDGLKVVKVRSESMAAAARAGEPHGMLSVVGLTDEDVKQLCAQVLKEVTIPAAAGGTVCQLANMLFPQGRVLSGHIKALERAAELAKEKGALKAQMLAVSGAFHTRLMEPARAALSKVLSEVTFHEPRIPIYSNVTAQPFPSAAEMPGLLARQLVEPVQWEGTLTQLLREAGKRELYELGPGQQIKAMVRRLDSAAWKAFRNVAP